MHEPIPRQSQRKSSPGFHLLGGRGNNMGKRGGASYCTLEGHKRKMAGRLC